MKERIIIETPRLILRAFEARDIDAMTQVLCDLEVMRFSMGAKNPADIRAWIEDCIESYSSHGLGRWAVVLRHSGEVIGYCGLTPLPVASGESEIELGFRLARRFWAQGYATEAATAVRDFAFNDLALPSLIALVDPGNTASIRVLEKIGMTHEKDIMLPGYDHPDWMYVIRRFGEGG